MEVIFVRHTSVDVPQGTCYGWTDVPVRDTFAKEAAATRQLLETHGALDAVYSSPLTRARMLAEYCIGDAMPITTDDRLKEMNMGDWEMKRFDDIGDPYIEKWYGDYLHLPTPNGESFQQQRSRVDAFLDELKKKKYRRVAVFAHGGVLVCAGIYGGLFTEAHAWDHLVPYGALQPIEI